MCIAVSIGSAAATAVSCETAIETRRTTCLCISIFGRGGYRGAGWTIRCDASDGASSCRRCSAFRLRLRLSLGDSRGFFFCRCLSLCLGSGLYCRLCGCLLGGCSRRLGCACRCRRSTWNTCLLLIPIQERSTDASSLTSKTLTYVSWDTASATEGFRATRGFRWT